MPHAEVVSISPFHYFFSLKSRTKRMMELKRGISRFFISMNKVNKLQSGYLEALAEVATLKESRRSLKEKLRRVPDELEMIDKIGTLKFNKRMTIDGLEHLLERTRNQIKKLEKIGDRAFEKREKLKAKAMKEADFEGNYYGADSSSIVVVNQVDDVASVVKMMKLLRSFHYPVCKIGDEVDRVLRCDQRGGFEVQGDGGWWCQEEIGCKD